MGDGCELGYGSEDRREPSGYLFMTPEQFSNCLAKGLGRTHLYLQEHDAEPYKDAILHGCLYNLAYDPQCEGTRTDYLYKLIQLTHDSEWFRGPILEALKEPDEEMDVAQLMEFALRFAQEGDDQARKLMYEKCSRIESYYYDSPNYRLWDYNFAYLLIDLDGIEGFLLIANTLGEFANRVPDFTIDSELLDHLQEKIGPVDLDRLRVDAKEKYPFLPVYLDRITVTTMDHKKTPSELQTFYSLPYIELGNFIEQIKEPIPHMRFCKWGKNASNEDLEKAARDLLIETDVKKLTAYVSIFGERPFPLNWNHLIPLAWHEDYNVSRFSIKAIRLITHPKIRELATELVKANKSKSEAVELLQSNYQDGDEKYLLQVLEESKDKDEYHWTGYHLKEVISANLSKAWQDVLIHLYENTPCSLCRYHFMECMIRADILPECIKHEAVFDSHEEIRKMVGAMKSGELQ